MSDPKYLAQLERGNIGVVLGPEILTIDIDTDDGAAEFRRLNPPLEASLCTRGARGCNFWFVPVGEFPTEKKYYKLKLNGESWGEFRSKGSQTIIHGLHPSGVHYTRLVDAPPARMPFEAIQWPKGLTGLPKVYQLKEFRNGNDGEDGNERYDGNHVVNGARVCVSSPASTPITWEHVLSVATPTEVHQTHSALWTLARGAKAIEKQEGAPLTPERLKAAFDRWRQTTPPDFLTNDPEDYYMEFLSCYSDVKYPLGTGNTLNEAFERARSNPLPPEANLVNHPTRKLLIALCNELQNLAGNEPFFLSCLDAGKMLNTPWRTVLNWLDAFTVLGILQVVEKANFAKHRSTRFRYVKISK